jgi:aspartate kinase
MKPKVFKFGGASLKDADGVRNVAAILARYQTDSLVIIVSAMGKTTNALEDIVRAYFAQDGRAIQLLDNLRQKHYAEMDKLFDKNEDIYSAVNDTFVEIEWVLEDEPKDEFNYVYDQIVGVGELVSSKILGAYLQKIGLPTAWLDARSVIVTDENWRESRILWDDTRRQMNTTLLPLLAKGGFVISQGFIGSTKDNNTTTLGREGSDFSAAIFANCSDAEGMYIWKDVDGVYNGDPRIFKNAVKLAHISYREAIEMTYYGATVVHPRTIAPLMQKNIALNVRSFLQHDVAGTVIDRGTEGGEDEKYPPIFTLEKGQRWLRISNYDNTFLYESHIAELFEVFARHAVFVNLMQVTGAAYLASVTDAPEKMELMMRDLAAKFSVVSKTGLDLYTVRHYNDEALTQVKADKKIVFEVRLPETCQILVEK